MTTQDVRDLSLLGLGSGASMPEIRAAYRNLVRQHHPDLCGQDRAANARLAAVNAAYGRLAAAHRAGRPRRWAPETVFSRRRSHSTRAANDAAARSEPPRRETPSQESRPPRGPRTLRFETGLRAALAQFAQRKRGQEAFYRLQEARHGIYPDPRRCGSAETVDLPGIAHALGLSLSDGTLHIQVDGSCKAGRNLLILPAIEVGADGGLRVGEQPRSFEFRCPRAGSTIRLHPRQLPVEGVEGLRVEIHYARATSEAA